MLSAHLHATILANGTGKSLFFRMFPYTVLLIPWPKISSDLSEVKVSVGGLFQ